MTAGLPGAKRKNVRARGGLRRSIVVLVVTASLGACGGDEEETQGAPADERTAPTRPPDGNPAPAPTNSAPTIGGSPPSQVLAGDSYDFTPLAADADGDVLTFSIENQPSWASFDERTGRLSGTPGEEHAGSYPGIRISVSDGLADASLPPFTITVVYTTNGTATLTWTPPTQRTDGSPLDLGGYRVYWGTSSRSYSHSKNVGKNVVTYVVDNLTPATWYFAVTALDSQGLESDFSNEAVKVVR
ncbi:MAG: putative Ig domain-containing protein [Gammaproteobacteria bacterium]